MSRLFVAKSPRTGEMRQWVALIQLGDTLPHAISSDDVGEDESYHPNEPGYDELYREYFMIYGDS